MKPVCAWTAFAVLILGLAPAFAQASAIPADLFFDRFPGEIPFAPAEAAAPLAFQYRCSGFSSVKDSTPQNVSFFVEKAPEWLTARIEPARIELPLCEGVGNASARVVASAANGSIALPGDQLMVRAQWETDGFLVNLTQSIGVSSPYVPLVRVEVAENETVARPQTPVVFPVKITNLASGNTRITFEVVSKDDALMIPVPNPVVLQHRGSTHESAQIPFTIQTPYRNGPMDEVGTVTFRLTPAAALDPSIKGESQEISFVVHTKGFYVPSSSVVSVVAAAFVVALVARSKK